MTTDLYEVPSFLEKLYNAEPEPTELDILRALQGEGILDYAHKMAYALYPTMVHLDPKLSKEYSTRSDFNSFVAHRIKLERINMKVLEAKAIHDSEDNKAANDERTTCLVCGEIAPDNYLGKPCKRCIVVIEQRLSASKAREAAVDKWLKSNKYDRWS